jgi:hypothetical protein
MRRDERASVGSIEKADFEIGSADKTSRVADKTSTVKEQRCELARADAG